MSTRDGGGSSSSPHAVPGLSPLPALVPIDHHHDDAPSASFDGGLQMTQPPPLPPAISAAAAPAPSAFATPAAAMRRPLLDAGARRSSTTSTSITSTSIVPAGGDEGEEGAGGGGGPFDEEMGTPRPGRASAASPSSSSSSSSRSSSSSSSSSPGSPTNGSPQQQPQPPVGGLRARLRTLSGGGHSGGSPEALHAGGGRHSPLPRSSRLIERDGKRTGHAKARWNLTRVGKRSLQDSLESILFDSFNTLLMAPTSRTLGFLAAAYLTIVTMFAVIYVALAQDESCNLGIDSFTEGFYFSLETMATVGYGANDHFFGSCKSPAVVITLQVLISMVVDSTFIGLLFLRFSRPHKRTKTVLFSDSAVVAPVTTTTASDEGGGRRALALSFRVAELSRYELIEPRVRMYAVRHDADSGTSVAAAQQQQQQQQGQGNEGGNGRRYFQVFPLKLHAPADGLLLMTLPATVAHVLDDASPLVPPGWGKAGAPTSSSSSRPPSSLAETAGAPSSSSSLAAAAASQPAASWLVTEAERHALEAFWQEEEVEIVVLVEGVDPLTSNSLQAKYSYKLQDLAFNHGFAPCVFVRHFDGSCVVDGSRFHNTVPLAAAASSSQRRGVGGL